MYHDWGLVVMAVFLALALGLYLWWLMKRIFPDATGRPAVLKAQDYDLLKGDSEANQRVIDWLAMPSHRRYEIKIVDWGPDFTGKDDILPRWRWAVWDADREIKDLLGSWPAPMRPDGTLEPRLGIDLPFMLGNEQNHLHAWFAGVAWVEKQEHPVLVVQGEDL